MIIERQVEDRTILPEWQALDRDTTERLKKLIADARYRHLYRDFPGGN